MVGRAVVGHAVGRAVGVRRGGASWWGVVVGRDAGNLYLNSCFCREKVEKPSPACRESLPKTGKPGEMGRETKPRLPEISTQNRENRRNG